MVSDVTRTGEWSPETTSCRWLAGAVGPEVGARFAGSNRNKIWRWSSRCRVTEAMPGECFAFDVGLAGLPISRWRYDLRPTGDGCEVTESTVDLRSALMKRLSVIGTGVADRASHNRRTMRATLAALAKAAESTATAKPEAPEPEAAEPKAATEAVPTDSFPH